MRRRTDRAWGRVRATGTSTSQALLLLAVGLWASPLAASAQQPSPPRFEWVISSSQDTVFERPEEIAADPSTGRVFVSDGLRRRVFVIDAATGHVLGGFGREGAGPGEFRAPDVLAVSAARDRVAVYDLLAHAVSFFDRAGRFLGRRAVAPLLIWPKGIAVLNDSLVVIASGVQSPGDQVPALHWLEPQSPRLTSTGPFAATSGGTPAQRARANAGVYVAGGPLLTTSSGVLFADGPTGDVWAVGRDSARLIARGPGAPPDLGERMVILGTTEQGERFFRPWWTFPRAVLLDTLAGGRFLLAMTIQDSALVRFYELRPGAPARPLGTVRATVRSASPYDRTSCVVSGEDSLGGYFIGRLRYPFSR